MKYLKQFETEAAYVSYKDGSDFITPNVSYIEENIVVKYNPYEEVESKLVKEIIASNLGIEMDFGLGWWTCWRHNISNDTPIEGNLKNIVLKPKDTSIDISNLKCAVIFYSADLDGTFAMPITYGITVKNNTMLIDNGVINEYLNNDICYGVIIGVFKEYDEDYNEILDPKAIDTIMEYELV